MPTEEKTINNLKHYSMRRLPNKRTEKHNLIIKAVEDYFGEANPQEKKSITKIALWLINRRKGVSLIEGEEEIKETIKVNLQDGAYSSVLTGNSL